MHFKPVHPSVHIGAINPIFVQEHTKEELYAQAIKFGLVDTELDEFINASHEEQEIMMARVRITFDVLCQRLNGKNGGA